MSRGVTRMFQGMAAVDQADPGRQRTSWSARVRSVPLGARLRNVSWELVAVITVQLLFLADALKVYFWDDDIINRSTSGALANDGINFITGANRLIGNWWRDEGRFYPVSFYQGMPPVMLLHDARAYKALLIFWTIACGVCVYLLLREIGLGRAGAALALLFATTAMQFRPFDPILAFGGLEQIIFGEIALSLLFFHRWLRLGKRWHLILALALFVLSSLTYESSYVYGPLYFVLALSQRRQLVPAIKAVLPLVGLSLIFIAIGSYGRAHASAGAHGPYAPSWNLHELLYTLGDQMVAALPLTYSGFDPTGSFHPFHAVVLAGLGKWDLLIGLAFMVVSAALLARIRVHERWNPLVLIALGLGLWVLTAAPIALATRYQQEIVAGLAHIPVIIETFAVGMVFVGIVGTAGRHASPPVRGAIIALLAVLLGATAALGHRANAIVVASAQPGRAVGRTLEKAASTAVRDRVATGSTLYVDPADGGNSPAFYRQYSGHKLTTAPADPAKVRSIAKAGGPCSPDRPGTWWLRAANLTSRTGYAMLSCAGGPGGQLTVFGLPADRVAVRATSLPTDLKVPPTGVFGLASDVDLDKVPDRIDPYNVAVQPVGPQTVMADWTDGCWAAEPTPGGVAHWCQDHAGMTVIASMHRAQRATIQVPIIQTGDRARRIVVTGPGGLRSVTPAGRPAQVTVDVPATGAVHLDVHVEGARRLPGVTGGRDARMLVSPAIPVS
jgi:hypothetical protein